MTLHHPALAERLLQQGVRLPDPASTFLDPTVDPTRIGAGTIIHPGCRLFGAALAIGPGCVLGEEGPLTLRDCQLGPGVRLRGGSFERATLLEGVDAGSGAHVRPGTLLEEHVTFGHCVGLKQTILFPHVTMGSLINFCDCLMAGGTAADNHGEVGSSYVHFNFTPHGDKATASLLGDVPNGALLNQHPIFLGGQGGLVGPCRLAFGTLLPAGQICRRDILQPEQMVVAAAAAARERAYDNRIYGNVTRLVRNNLIYLGNLLAMDQWYRHVRAPRLSRDANGRHCLEGALARLGECLADRARWLETLASKVRTSSELLASRTSAPPAEVLASQQRFVDAWPRLAQQIGQTIQQRARVAPPAEILPAIAALAESREAHVPAVQALTAQDREDLRGWLQSIVDGVSAGWIDR